MAISNWEGFERYKQLASAFGPPGMEAPVRKVLMELTKPYSRQVEVDSIGNLYAVIGPDEAPTIMLSAHMDEIALVVSDVTERGYLRVAPQGLIHPSYYRLQPVTVLGTKGHIPGVSNVTSERAEVSVSDIYLDVGARSADEVSELGILPGDRVCFSSQIRPHGSELIVGKAADDRVGLYVLTEVARRFKIENLAIRLVLVGTVQEEGVDTFIAWVGAHVAAQRLGPALMLGVDTIDSWDDMYGNTPPGKPSAILMKGLGILRGAQDLHPGAVDYLLSRAQTLGLQNQIIPLAATAADYTSVARSREGIPCAGVAIPIRHSHSASEIFRWKSVEDAITLVLDIVSRPLELLQITSSSSD